METHNSDSSGWERIIHAIKSPLSLFALFILVSYTLLIPLVNKAEDIDKTVAIIGMIVVLILILVVVFFIALYRPELLRWAIEPKPLPANLTFERVINEVESSLERLEKDDYKLTKFYLDRGDGQRLIDGIFSSLLYCSRAIIKGQTSPLFYGNLMDYDPSIKSLRVHYSSGPYHDQIVVRQFPLEGDKQGVASSAVNEDRIQIINDTINILKLPKESRLKAMLSLPIENKDILQNYNGEIMVLNIDSVEMGIFPTEGSEEFDIVDGRLKLVKNCLKRMNKIQRVLKGTLEIKIQQ